MGKSKKRIENKKLKKNMKKELKTLSVAVNGIMINGRNIYGGNNDLYVSFPNGVKHFIIEDRFHYEWEKSHYNITLILHSFDDENDKWELRIKYINDYCTRVTNLIKLSERGNDDFNFRYPLIGETKDDIYNDRFAIFDIWSLPFYMETTLRDYPFNCQHASNDVNDEMIRFSCYYKPKGEKGKDIVVLLISFDVVNGEIINLKFTMDLADCYISESSYNHSFPKRKITVEVSENETIEEISEKIKKEFQKINQ